MYLQKCHADLLAGRLHPSRCLTSGGRRNSGDPGITLAIAPGITLAISASGLTLTLAIHKDQSGRTIEEMRADMYGLARGQTSGVCVFFALNNLETLADEELEELDEFLSNLPASCKAIVTTRDDRRSGRRLSVPGLSFHDSLELIHDHLNRYGIELDVTETSESRELFKLTEGVPLHLKYFSNLLLDGHPMAEAVAKIRGERGLSLLEFTFESSLQSLPETAVEIAYYLALTSRPGKRRTLLNVAGDDEAFTEARRRLEQTSFVQRVADSGKQVSFNLTDRF